MKKSSKFTIEVEMTKHNIIKKASVLGVLDKPIVLKKATINNPPGESWLVFSDEGAHRMIVLSQMDF